MTRKEDQLRDAFVAIGIPGNLAHQALAQFPTAQTNQQDVDVLLNSVGYPSGYGTVKVAPQQLPAQQSSEENDEPKAKKNGKKNGKGK